MTKKPKIVLWDIETSLIIATTFSLFPEKLPHDGILQDWFILSGAWKVLGEKTVHSVSVADFKRKSVDDDFGVVAVLHAMLLDVDILIHHNGDKFDLKKLNSRLIFHGFPPLPKIQTIDTLKVAKKVGQFTSNRLDYLSKYLVGRGKEKTSPDLWLKCMKGDKEALKEMVKYNKVDVVRLEEVYKKFKPYIPNPPRVSDVACSCPSCGSIHVNKHKPRLRSTGLWYQQYQCSCGHYFMGTKHIQNA
jgi:DNA polymerase elongation subunit (family B)